MTEQFQAEAEFKFMDADAAARGEFMGYASTFGNVDLGGDIVERGAFAGTLAKKKAADIPMLWGHDMRAPPIGKWLELREDDRGLVARGQLILDVAKARDVHALMKEGALKGMSIGYMVPPGGAEFDRTRSARRLKTVDLFEVSVVTMPMNTRAQVQRVKASEMSDDDLKNEIEAALTMRGAGLLSRAEARAVIRGGLTALKAMRGAGETGSDPTEALSRLIATIRS